MVLEKKASHWPRGLPASGPSIARTSNSPLPPTGQQKTDGQMVDGEICQMLETRDPTCKETWRSKCEQEMPKGRHVAPNRVSSCAICACPSLFRAYFMFSQGTTKCLSTLLVSFFHHLVIIQCAFSSDTTTKGSLRLPLWLDMVFMQHLFQTQVAESVFCEVLFPKVRNMVNVVGMYICLKSPFVGTVKWKSITSWILSCLLLPRKGTNKTYSQKRLVSELQYFSGVLQQASTKCLLGLDHWTPCWHEELRHQVCTKALHANVIPDWSAFPSYSYISNLQRNKRHASPVSCLPLPERHRQNLVH